MRKNRVLGLVSPALQPSSLGWVKVGGFAVFATATALACSTQRDSTVAAQMPAVSAPAPLPRVESVNPVTRHTGDFLVHVVSGSFRKQPALFTEHVLAQEGTAWVIEYTLEDDTGTRSLKAWTEPDGEVTRVSLRANGDETPGTLDDYEAFMGQASVAPDENVGLMASTRGTCTVGPSELDCETKSYRVLLGDQEAQLGITGSQSVPGLDLAGEITASDGTVIYRSILVERGNDGNAKDDDSFALK